MAKFRQDHFQFIRDFGNMETWKTKITTWSNIRMLPYECYDLSIVILLKEKMINQDKIIIPVISST